MELSSIKDILYIAGAIGGGIVSFVGAVAWLTKVHNDIKENRRLRHEDKEEIMERVHELENKIDRVELETRQRVEDTFRLFTEIKEQLARWEGKFEVFFKNK